MKMSPLQRRAERRDRNQTSVDLNLVSLIDIFTILIFFLLANESGIEVIPNSKAVKLPESISEKAPKETVVIVVSDEDILVQGRRVTSVAEAMQSSEETIEPLKTELDYQARQKLIGNNNSQETAVDKDITIMGDKNIPYSLIKKIMVTSARAKYSNISFAVLKKNKG